jgi:hypothetical protein
MLVLASAGAASTPSSFHVAGFGINPSDWTVDKIQTQLADQIKPIQYTSHGAKHTFDCIPLIALLQAAGVPADFVMKSGVDPKLKNPQLRQVIIVSGRDGYAVVFSMAEVLPMVGDRPIWVALDEDGQPLNDNDEPVRLIVPDDKMPARGVHQVASIDIVQLSTPTTQPQHQ